MINEVRMHYSDQTNKHKMDFVIEADVSCIVSGLSTTWPNNDLARHELKSYNSIQTKII